MTLSREAKLMLGISLLTVPTIQFGGLTLLGLATGGGAGFAPDGLVLEEAQKALFRAGHAHAGVLLILSLVVQIVLDAARLSSNARWVARISALLAAILMSGGFFGLAFAAGFQWLLYFGGACLAAAVLLSGIGLLRALDDGGPQSARS